MLRLLPALALLACVLLPPPVRAAGIAVMGLHPGMTVAEVLAALRPQTQTVARRLGACPGRGAGRCLRALSALVPDGRILVSFAGSPARAWRIRLLTDTTADPRRLRAAALASFGPPAQPGGLLWCARSAGRGCGPKAPRLRLRSAPGGGSILSLSDPSLRQPGS
ncbi:MAG: hypothetical protein ACP5NP_01735 [Acetobacteraceae bacterium]